MASSILTVDELNSMSALAYKIHENRLRRMAQRQGLRLEKCSRRDPHALGWRTYRLTDHATNTLVAGDRITGYGLGLDDVERVLQRVDTS